MKFDRAYFPRANIRKLVAVRADCLHLVVGMFANTEIFVAFPYRACNSMLPEL